MGHKEVRMLELLGKRIRWKGKIYRVVGDDAHSHLSLKKLWDYILHEEESGKEVRVYKSNIEDAEIINE